MDLKFYLNKIAKIGEIEGYTLKTLNILRKQYEEFLEKTDGVDPDYPMLSFGKAKGTKLKLGTNAYSIFGDEDNIPEDYRGLDVGLLHESRKDTQMTSRDLRMASSRDRKNFNKR